MGGWLVGVGDLTHVVCLLFVTFLTLCLTLEDIGSRYAFLPFYVQ